MKESINNLRLVHSDCAFDKLKKFQSTFDPLVMNVGGFIKTFFGSAEKRDGEWMWVEIKQIDIKNRKIIGVLSNDPFYVENINCGDEVIISFKKIQEYQFKF